MILVDVPGLEKLFRILAAAEQLPMLIYAPVHIQNRINRAWNRPPAEEIASIYIL